MSSLSRGDQDMHYEDGSHRWVPPDDSIAQKAWDAQVTNHLQQHRLNMGPPSGAPRRNRTNEIRNLR